MFKINNMTPYDVCGRDQQLMGNKRNIKGSNNYQIEMKKLNDRKKGKTDYDHLQ